MCPITRVFAAAGCAGAEAAGGGAALSSAGAEVAGAAVYCDGATVGSVTGCGAAWAGRHHIPAPSATRPSKTEI